MKIAGARCLLFLAALVSLGASHRTQNFVVTAPTPDIARQVGVAAEQFRRELAIEWLGHELPRWYAPCPIQVKVGEMGAGGATSFSFDRGEVFGWTMSIQGPLDRLLDSVLPHEISHTIFACYFRRPLPRWADEGAATLAEHESERRRQFLTVQQIIGTQARIPLRKLMAMKDYPSDMRDVMTLYAEGYLLAELLVQQGGKALYLQFLNDAHKLGWDRAVATHYGYDSVDSLEKSWHDWIRVGSPALSTPPGEKWARMSPHRRPGSPADTILRAQSPDTEDPFLIAGKSASPASRPTAARPSEVPADNETDLAGLLPQTEPAANATFAADPPAPLPAEESRVEFAEAGPESSAPPYVPPAVNLPVADASNPADAWNPRRERSASASKDNARSVASRGETTAPGRAPRAAAPAPRGTRTGPADHDFDRPAQPIQLPLSSDENAARRSNAAANPPAAPRRRIVPQWSEFPQDPRPSPWGRSGK